MRGNRVFVVVSVLTVAALTAVGCSKPPQADIDAAKQALGDAKVAEAPAYAADEWVQAEDAAKLLDTELKLQGEKFAMFRSYKHATELASAAKTAAEDATQTAVEAKDQAREEAMATIEQVRAMLVEVQDMLAKAPTGKGTQADLAALRSDLDGVQLALAEADASYQSGRYLDAQTGASAALTSVEQVKADIDAAVRAREASRAKRRQS